MSTADAAAGSPRIQTEIQVMFFDTDCAGVVHNIAYLRMIEVARTLLAEQLGMGLAEMAKTRIFPVVVRTEIDYRRPAQLGDTLVIDGWLDVLERGRFWVAFNVGRKSDSTLIAQCRQLMAVIQHPPGKVVRLPADWAEKYAHLRTPAVT